VTLRQIANVTGDSDVCLGDTIHLEAADLAGASFLWSGPDNFISDLKNPQISGAQISNSGTYSVVGTILGCATFPATVTTTVHPLAQPDLGTDVIFCPDEVELAQNLDPGRFITYEWSTGSSAPTLPVSTPGAYTVTVSDEFGCIGSDSILFTSLCPTKFYVPNVFTPNNDGENDFFEIFSTDMAALNLQVYDRWGDLVFETRDINGSWDGSFRNQPLPTGVYVWVARITAYERDGTTTELIERGDVTLIR
jgi:gliding motility-associated-like protein